MTFVATLMAEIGEMVVEHVSEQEQFHDAAVIATALLPEMAGHDDVAVNVDDSIASGEMDWVDQQRAAYAAMTPEQRREWDCKAFDLYGEYAA